MLKNNAFLELDNEEIEIKFLMEEIFLKYGYDFRNYSESHIKRRLLRRLTISRIDSIAEMISKVLNDRSFFEILLADFSINVTEMFRDPPFYKALRKDIIPLLRTYPLIKIWHAGCATGEEVYSMAMLLKEEGLYDKCQIYATDFNEVVLQKAREGIYPIDHIMEYTKKYQQAGGIGSFSDYYTAESDNIILNQSLKEKIIFANHNLVTDGIFGEMNIIICRNVLIYFNKILQNRVITLFYESLAYGGVLCLGTKEGLRFSKYEEKFMPVDFSQRIFQKKFEAY